MHMLHLQVMLRDKEKESIVRNIVNIFGLVEKYLFADISITPGA